ncbi:hypothetical protein [Marivirga sp.]|uniref:hypothetical protein n=1 Tax=Marivirga sp. TaxID=2018662 RepID=UPI003DA71F78
MDFTKHEQTVINELEKRAGDVLYLKDIAPYFISKSLLQISTYTQTSYIQVGDNMQTALSEYFQLVVFLKKMEKNGACYSISYTPLEDNSIQIGNTDFEEYQQNTIADGDLLIQLFHFAAKKYVMVPNISEQFYQKPKQSKINFIIPSIILMLLFLFIGAIGYQSYEDHNKLKLKQEAIGADLEKQSLKIGLLSDQIQSQGKKQNKINKQLKDDFNLLNTALEEQNKSLKNIRFWNQKQFNQLEKLFLTVNRDSIE